MILGCRSRMSSGQLIGKPRGSDSALPGMAWEIFEQERPSLSAGHERARFARFGASGVLARLSGGVWWARARCLHGCAKAVAQLPAVAPAQLPW